MRVLWGISDFARAVRRELQFGELSRAPLELLRIEWRGDFAECHWLARRGDDWDQDVPRHVRGCNATEQALRDAIAVRELLFDALPEVNRATLRAFRLSEDRAARELIIAGAVTRGEEISPKVCSTAMKAKLLGFQFWFQDGVLEALPSEECEMSL